MYIWYSDICTANALNFFFSWFVEKKCKTCKNANTYSCGIYSYNSISNLTGIGRN